MRLLRGLILKTLWEKNAPHIQMRELVAVCFGAPSRQSERKRYQAAWASLSRAVARLQRDGLVFRWVRIIQGDVGVGLTDEGRRLYESLVTTHLTEPLQQNAATIPVKRKRNPTPTERAAKVMHVSAKYVYYAQRIQREAPELYAQMERGKIKILAAWRKLRAHEPSEPRTHPGKG
jgi:hypothetical protein